MAGEMYLIHGSEEVVVERSLAAILHEHRDHEKRVVDCSEAEVGAIAEATEPSLFADKRILVVKNLQDLDSEMHDEVDRYIQDPDPALVVVWLHKGGVKGKGLLDRVKKKSTKVFPAEPLKKASEKMEFLQGEFKTLGRKIAPAALAALVAGYADMREMVSASRQINNDTPQGKVIDEDEVLAHTRGRKLTTGFDVADAVIAKDPRKALVATRYAFDSGIEPIQVLSAITMSVKSMLKVIDLPRSTKSFEVAGELGMAPWQIDKARRQIASWSEDDFEIALNEIVRADWAVKGGEVHAHYAVERMVLAIASGGKLVKSPDQSTAWRKV